VRREVLHNILIEFRVPMKEVRLIRRRIFGPKRNEVTGGLRELDKEELHDLYSSPSIIRIIT
jgi:hypothetical protein